MRGAGRSLVEGGRVLARKIWTRESRSVGNTKSVHDCLLRSCGLASRHVCDWLPLDGCGRTLTENAEMIGRVAAKDRAFFARRAIFWLLILAA